MRKLGIEIECIIPGNRAGEAITQLSEIERVAITGDGSINGTGEGVEVKLGPLYLNDSGRTIVHQVCEVLREHRAMVNNSTGLHVHADCPELRDENNETPHKLLQNKWKAIRFFALAENLLRSCVPQTRRHNQYCLPLNRVMPVGGMWSNEICEAIRQEPTRYCGVNFASMARHGTIENRYHGGTTNEQKILHWCLLWEALVNNAVSIRGDEIEQLNEVVSEKARRDMLFALLSLPEGTETYLRERIRSFGASDSRKVATYIRTKKETR